MKHMSFIQGCLVRECNWLHPKGKGSIAKFPVCNTEVMNRKNQVKRTKAKQEDAPASERLSLTEKTINLGKDADIRLGKPDKVDIFIDQKTKIIRLVPSSIGKRIVRAKDGHI